MSLPLPAAHRDERDQLLAWLGWLRDAVLRKVAGIDQTGARWRPDNRLVPLVNVVHHLTRVEWRWIEGGFRGAVVERHEDEFTIDLPLERVVAAYRQRAAETDGFVRGCPLDMPCQLEPGADLRWVLLHLINETARHAGHADAVRELLDGTTGE